MSRFLLTLLYFSTLGPGQQFYLRPEDRVLFVSGSNAERSLHEKVIQAFVLTRFPEWQTEFRRWSEGDSTYSPTVLVASPSFGSVERLYSFSFLRTARLTSFDPGAPFHWPAATLTIDWDAFRSALAGKAGTTSPAATLEHGIPAGASGHLLIAQAVLQAWHAPALVSAVEINALHGIIIRSENTNVRDLENGRVIAWSQDDRALPVAIDFKEPAIAATVAGSEFVRLLDQETLRITGMAAERYRLTIDGKPQGEFHRDQLDRGLTLSLMATPMWKQSMEVYALTRRQEEFDASRRQLLAVSVPERRAQWKSEWEALDNAEAAFAASLRSKARPKTHDYELQPVEH